MLSRLLCLTGFILLSACAISKQPPASDDPLNQICENLKLDILNTSNTANSPQFQNPIEAARLDQEYAKYNCDEVLK